ncbi:MAG: tetratricopeptide repeat protein [Candidatus Aminicenantes bacterium]|nr:tetratricopeptide repeat protein [Candidatus Aminicenantes bacterium]
MKKSIFAACAVFLFILALGTGPYSQEGRGQGRLIGSVVDEAGNPVEGVKITLRSERFTNTLTTTSNAKGQWGFIGLGRGDVTLTVEKEGYIQTVVPLQVSGLKQNPQPKIILKKKGDPSAGGGLSDSAKEMLLQGNELFEQKKFTEAADLYQKFLDENPALYQVRLNLGNCLMELQNYCQALAEYQKVLDGLNAEPAEKRDIKLVAQMYASMGEAYLAQNKFKEAEENFVKSIDINPSDSALPYNVAEILMQAGNPEGAIRYYEMAIRLKPDWPKAYLKLGYAWLNKGDNPKALESFKKVIEIAPPDDPDAALAKDVIKALSAIK